MIIGHNLYPAEQKKLTRLEEKLVSAFVSAGHPQIQICEATGAGDARTITFRSETSDSSSIRFTALAFLASTSDELARMIEGYLSKPKAI